MLNGEGLRTVLWVAGCSHNCPQCHNPVTWDINGGLAFDEAANIDVIVDGEFKIEEKDNSLHWKGSANQRVIDVKESLKTGKVQLYRKY